MIPPLPYANVVLITLDCVRPDFLGCYGCQSVTTNTLDRIAHRGIVCEQAITQAPNTWVAHAGILTGRYPPSHGLRSPYDRLDPSMSSIASILSAYGYRTAGFPGNDLVGSRAGFHCGFDLFFEQYRADGTECSSCCQITANYRNMWDDVLEAFRDWVDQASQPFFAWFHYFDTHHLPRCDVPDFYRFSSEAQWQFYEGKISYADQRCIQAIVDELLRIGAYDRTLIAILGDHGEELLPGAPPSHNGSLCDAVLRVPMILGAENLPWKGLRIPSQVRTVDLLPTLLLLVLGQEPFTREELTRTLSGHPLPLPGLESFRTTYPCVSPHLAYAENEPLGALCVRTETWKFIAGPMGEALYHLASDPAEIKNVCDRYPSTAAYFKHELTELLAQLPLAKRIPASTEYTETYKLLQSMGYVG